jgi:hypothetical protein
MTEEPSLAELLRVVIVVGGLLLSGWAIVDDVWDLVNVRRYGEVGGPRWVLAVEHLWFNGTLLVGWLCALGVVGIAISLPPREDADQDLLATVASWLTFGFGVCVLLAQGVRRAGRLTIRALPLVAWEQMLASMVDGMSAADRASFRTALLRSTAAGRELGHLAANEMQPAMGLLSMLSEDARIPSDYRADAASAVEALDRAIVHIKALHAEIRAQDPSYTPSEPKP